MRYTGAMKAQSFIFIGRSGCGKGTQAKLLVDYLKTIDPSLETLYIQTGQEFRDFIKGDSHTQKLSNQLYLADKLQPEFLSVYMWIRILINKYDGKGHIIFDGTPRRKHEAGVLGSIINFYNLPKPFVILLDVSEDWSREKLLARHRMDDKEEDIEKRLAWFMTDVVPAIEFYKNSDDYHFVQLNGEQSIEDVYKDLIERIKSLL